MDFCLCGAVLNLKAFCFGAIPDIMMLTVIRSHDEIVKLDKKRTDRAVITVNIIMSGIAPKQNAFKFKIAPHKQKSIVKNIMAGRLAPWPTGSCA
jgi:hypothetical protein